MKNRIIKTSLVLTLVLWGCAKEELLEPVSGNEATDVYYVLNQKGDAFTWGTISNEPNVESGLRPIPSNGDVYTRGAYLPVDNPSIILTWNGFSDAMGVHGTAEVKVVAPTFSFHFLMESAAIVGEGNNAVFEGTIVDIIARSGDAPEFDLFWRFCFNVIDSNSVTGNDFDKICNAMLFGSPRSLLICSVYPPGHHIWLRAGFDDVEPPGFVEVSDQPDKIR